MRLSRLISCVAALAGCAATLCVAGQTSSVAPRITAAVDNESLTVLTGSLSPVARPEFDRGPADPAQLMRHMRLVLARSAQQEQALRVFGDEQIEPSSPNYHHWLTPQQFGRLYGPADSDIAAITAWLESCGLTVDSVPPGRTEIVFSGSVAQVQAAFHMPIHSFARNGEEFIANTVNPSIPAALTPVVKGVANLSTLRPVAHNVPGPMGKADPRRHLVRADPAAAAPRTALTTGSSGSYFLYMTPADAATIYDSPNHSFNAAYAGSTQYDGTGVTIGIVGDAVIHASTVTNYRNLFLGNSVAPTITNVDDVVSTSDTDEGYIDTELSGGMAPGATIHFYTAVQLSDAIVAAISDNAVDILSVSYGECEANLSTADNAEINGWWQQASQQGIAVTVSTGDDGSAACDNQNKVYYASNGLQVSGFASTPYDIAVGGTDFEALVNEPFANYVGTSNSATNHFGTAYSYIPESTWNDSTETDTTISANVPYVDGTTHDTNIVGGNGGVSSCSTNNGSTRPSGCTSGYAKPSWQQGTGVPADGARDVPDVSLMAGNGFDYATWLICTDDTGTVDKQTVTLNCAQTNGEVYFAGFGGTSTSAPAFAGILAMVQQSVGSRVGVGAAKTLYGLFNSAKAAAVYHDVTIGNNSVPCQSGALNCSKNGSGEYFLTGYNTGTGYDLATGMGSVDAAQLVLNWSGNSAAAATVNVTPSAASITTTEGLTVTVDVVGSGSATPTGTVVLSTGTFNSGTGTLSAGSYVFHIGPGVLLAGTDTLSVAYSGDTNYSPATGTTTVTVAGLTPFVSVTPSVTSTDSSQTLSVAVAVTGTGPTPTGTVTLNSGTFASGTETLNGSGAFTFTIPAASLAAGNDVLTVAYSGDTNYLPATGTSSVTVTESVYGLAGTAPAAVAPGGAGSSTVTVSSTTGYIGTVTLTCALTASPSGATDLPTCSFGTGSLVTLSSSTTSTTATLSIATTGASSSLQRRTASLWRAGGGATLALAVFLIFPRRRRRWVSLLGALAMLAVLGSFAACGGGGGGSTGGGGGSGSPGTTAGVYTFTITGTGSPAVTPAPTTTVSLTVN